MKRRLCVLLAGLMLSLPGCAGYYPAYGYRPAYGYSAPVYGSYGYRPPAYRSPVYAPAYPAPVHREHRSFYPEGGRGGERHEHHEGGEGRGWGEGHGHG